jgi:hypothetical protein
MAEIARYVARMLIPKFIDLGYIGSAIIRELKTSGYSYRYQVMLKDIREQQQISVFGEAVRKLADNVKPPKSIMTETELSAARKYRVFGTAKYVNIETGRTTYEPISFYTDTLRTKEKWAEDYIGQKEESKYREDVSVEGIDIYALEHNEGWRY